MKPNNSNELQIKIDEKLEKFQKHNTMYSRNATARTKDKHQVMAQIKWNTIKRYLKLHKMQRKDTEKGIKLQVKAVMKNEELIDIISRVMILQEALIKLSQNVANYRRLQMGLIFFQCSLSIVFNAYNLVVFLLKIAFHTADIKLSLAMLLFFYGYHILSSLADIIISIVAYHNVYETIRKTATIVDELYMYISDDIIKSRLSQFSTFVYNNLRVCTLFGLYNLDGTLIASIISGTATYIIILIQYSGDGEICENTANVISTKTSTNPQKT